MSTGLGNVTNDCTSPEALPIAKYSRNTGLRRINGPLALFPSSFRGLLPPVIPQQVIDDIVAALDLPDFIGETVALAKQGSAYGGLCPFHNESTPSFKVFADHYHCYGCGAHGNGIEFVMHKQGLTFPEAVRMLASRTGVEIPSNKPSEAQPDRHAKARDVLRRACAKYQQLLLGPNGGPAMSALAERGIDDDTIIRFGIGFAPEAWATLCDDRTFRRDALLEAGLAVPRREKKGCYDFFRNRLLFPVRADNGDVIGFGGRRLGEEGPKYLNSPETDLYQKGSVLFGLQQARQAIRMTRSIIVCEGFFDVVTPSQAQIEHIVSTCGTALTETQAEMVLSLADRVFFCFDGDAAGAKATWRAAEMLVPLASDQHEIRLCRLPASEDPDSFVRKFGAPKFQEALDASPTLTAYLIGEITRGAKLPEARARSLSVAASLWRQFSAPGLGIFFRQFACEALQLTPAEFDRIAASAPRRDGENMLRSCPCCSGEASLISCDGGFQVQCSHCRIATPVTTTEDECRAIWNRRERPRMRSTTTKSNEKADQQPS